MDIRSLEASFDSMDYKGVIDEVVKMRTENSVSAAALVLLGKAIQLGPDDGSLELKDAEASFLEALRIEPLYAPALLQLGWYYFAVEDDAKRALPYFEQAEEICQSQLSSAKDGASQCREELADDQ
jgi:tetratricopeptide (TPR) repeat protein